MKLNTLTTILMLLTFFVACQEVSQTEEMENPQAEGFDLEGSDQLAIDMADKIMEAMGGRKAYDNTRYLKWNFFGARRHFWDKYTGDVKIESLRDSITIDMNINQMTGNVDYKGRQLTDQDSLNQYLQKGKEWWINDSYWLVMPYKLKDSGVTLKYMDQDTMQTGEKAEVLSLTFENVGVTPQNKYHVYIDTSDYLIKQWDYYSNATDSLPRFSSPWLAYQKYGDILLSGDRGGGRKLTEIAVGDSLAVYFQ